MAERRENNTPKRSKEPFRLPFDDLVDPAVIVDKHGAFLEVNRAVEEKTSFKREELVGRKFLEAGIVTEESKPVLREDLVRGMMGEKVRPHEIVALTKDGTKIPAELNAALIEYKGKPAGLAIFRDITERKRMENVLRESEEKHKQLSKEFETILNSLPALIFYKDKEGNFIRVNKYVADAHHMTKEELEDKSTFDLYPKEQAQAYLEDDLEVIESGKPKLFIKEPWETEEGKKWVSTSKIPYVDENGDVIGIIGISIDITERKRAEEALQESEERYRSVFTGTHDAMWIVKVKDGGEFIYEEINPAYPSLVGLDREDVVGKRLEEIFERETTNKILRDYEWVVKKKKPLEKEQHLKFPSGKKWRLTTLTPLLDENGNVDKIIGFSKDITLRKMFEKRIKAEREVYQSIARAANQSRSVEELCELALEGIRSAIKYDMADLSIYRESENALFSAAQVGFPEDLYRGTTERQDLEGPGVEAQVARTRKSVYIDDMKTSELASHRHDLIMKYDISTMYTVALVSRDKLQGVLQVITSGGRGFSKENREVLDTISEELAGGIAKAKIEERLVTAKEAFGWLAQG